MKNPNTGKTFLDLSDINTIMPEGKKICEERYSRGVYRMENGDLVSISNSRLYDKGYAAWYYVYIDRYIKLGVHYMLFTVGLTGIVLVPMSKMSSYKRGCSWKEGRFPGERRYCINIKVDNDGQLFFVNSSEVYNNRLAVMQHFIPFD